MRIGDETPAIVTGGASGLGEATARALAARGAKVAVLDLAVRGEIVAKQIGGIFCETDVTSDESVDGAIARAQETHGAPRIVVNCAGVGTPQKTIGRDGPIDMKHFQQVIQINLIGTMRVMSRAARLRCWSRSHSSVSCTVRSASASDSALSAK